MNMFGMRLYVLVPDYVCEWEQEIECVCEVDSYLFVPVSTAVFTKLFVYV